jgi:hypothetical protein
MYFYNKWIELPRVYGLDIIHLMNCKVKHNKIRAIIMHFIRNDFYKYKPWQKENPFYQEWALNLEKADLIDLKEKKMPKRWNIFKIYFYSLWYNFYLQFLFKIYTRLHIAENYQKIYQGLKRLVIHMTHLPERLIGLIGSLIKKISPKTHYNIKKQLFKH